MFYTRDEETALVKKYDPMLKSIAYRYMKRSYPYDHGRSDFEDIYQSARVGFINLLRTGKFNPEIMGYERNIFKEMFSCSLNNASITFDRKMYVSGMANVHEASMEDIAEPTIEDRRLDDWDASDELLNWMSTLSDKDHRIVTLIMKGMRWNDIIEAGCLKDHTDAVVARKRIGRSIIRDCKHTTDRLRERGLIAAN